MKNSFNGFYILDEKGKPKKVFDDQTWQRWLEETSHEAVAESTIGSVKVSTVFLAFDNDIENLFDEKDHAPLLYETMIFGGDHDGERWRWSTKDEAVRGHEKIVKGLA